MKVSTHLFTGVLMPLQEFKVHCSVQLKNLPKYFKALFINNN